MVVDRRTFLGLLGPAVLLPGAAFPAGAEGASDAIFLIVDGIAADTPADRLRAFADPFLAEGLPVGVIPTSVVGSGAALPPVLAGELGRLFTAAPHLTEPVLSLPGLASLSPYFQRRAASDALGRMRALIGGAVDMPPPVTVAPDAPLSANLDALRCLGIRSVLTLAAAEAVTSTGCADLSACLRGGRRLNLADTPDPARWLEDVLEAPGWRLIVLSLAGIERLTAGDLRLRARRVCDAIGREIVSGRRFAALPRDHARWFGDDQMRFVAVRLRPGTAASAASMARFRADIEAFGIPVTDTVRPEVEAWAEGLCAAPPAVCGQRRPLGVPAAARPALRCRRCRGRDAPGRARALGRPSPDARCRSGVRRAGPVPPGGNRGRRGRRVALGVAADARRGDLARPGGLRLGCRAGQEPRRAALAAGGSRNEVRRHSGAPRRDGGA